MRHAIAPAGRQSRVEWIVLVADLAGVVVFAVRQCAVSSTCPG
ncbi:hypothetical protein [Pseudomonas sp. AKS31]|nr:hypothetical protein [Pseudomonas sp. AKS31]